MSVNWHHHLASLHAWTWRVVSSVPVLKDMFSIPMESLVAIWMNAPPANITVSTNVSTQPEATSASVLKDIHKSTTSALVSYSFNYLKIEFQIFICKISCCPDVNECIEQPGVCISPAQCINTLGSFKCMCPRGFQLDQTGNQCVDNDECLDDSRCQNGCQVNWAI